MLQQKKMMSLLYGYFYHCEVCWIRATGSPSSSSSSLCWLRRFSPLSAERERELVTSRLNAVQLAVGSHQETHLLVGVQQWPLVIGLTRRSL